jgi:hypothetical protein
VTALINHLTAEKKNANISRMPLNTPFQKRLKNSFALGKSIVMLGTPIIPYHHHVSRREDSNLRPSLDEHATPPAYA